MTIGDGFWLFDTACTQALWMAVMGKNPSRFEDPDRPVDSVSWEEARAFIGQINERVPGLDLALPSEAQWEYACRAGTKTAYSFGSSITRKQAQYGAKKTVPVASLPPNPWGLYEMHGNVWEWCEDHWHKSYEGAPSDGSAWLDAEAAATAFRVLRGGSWHRDARHVRAASRARGVPDDRLDDLGFRCARVQGSGRGAAPADPATGREAEPRPASGPQGDAQAARLAPGARQATLQLPRSGRVRLRSDRAELEFVRITRPDWASALGRDRFGLFAAFTLDDVTQRLRWIPPGRFRMGSPATEPGRYDDEGPQREVTIGKGFWLFDTAVTQALWQAVMSENPSRFQSSERPVESVSWDQAQGFLGQINQLVPGLDLALPSEAQWEYACRAGTDAATYAGAMEILGEQQRAGARPDRLVRGQQRCGLRAGGRRRHDGLAGEAAPA